MAYPAFSEISRTFAPGWFAAVMGTGVLALTTHALAQHWPWLTLVGEILHWFNTALFLSLAAVSRGCVTDPETPGSGQFLLNLLHCLAGTCRAMAGLYALR